MPEFWKPTVELIQPGEPVSAETANRPLGELSAREAYLYAQFQSLNQRSGRLVAGGVELGAGAAAGDVVYLNAGTGRYEPARAEWTFLDGQSQIGARTGACGLVLSTDGFGLGDVLLQGVVNPNDYGLDPARLLDRVDAAFAPGPFYLSRLVAGRLSPVASAPVVPLGFFAEDAIVFAPVRVEAFNPHLHQAFDLAAKPAASQNAAGTGFDPATGRVDYFHGTSARPPLALGFRVIPGQLPAEDLRVDLSRDGNGQLAIALASGSALDRADPNSATAGSLSLGSQPFPAYGEYLSIPQAGIEVFFLRTDDNYQNALAVDAATLLAVGTDQFKVYLPADATGWTNANPFDPATPANARLRYQTETQAGLCAAFPPQPVHAADLTCNGLSLAPGRDFLVTLEGLWWCAALGAGGSNQGNYLGNPWPVDHTDAGTGLPANAVRLRLFFARSTYAAEGTAVTSLRSNTPALSVRGCPDGDEATTGDLQLDLDLALAADPSPVVDAETAFTSVDGVRLRSTSVVTELVSGDGISLTRLCAAPGSRFTGRVRVDQANVSLAGEITSIALRGGSEWLYRGDLLPYLSFRAPTTGAGPSGAIASFQIPGRAPAAVCLEVRTGVLGSVPVGSLAATAYALFKVVYHATRPGINLAQLSDATAAAVQWWRVPFAPGYGAFSLLAQEYPAAAALPSTQNSYALTPASIAANPQALLAATGLRPYDSLFVRLQRVTASPDNLLVDTYPGQVGFVGLRWNVSAA